MPSRIKCVGDVLQSDNKFLYTTGLTQVDQGTLQSLSGDTATKIIGNLVDEGVEGDGGGDEGGGGVNETLIPNVNRALQKATRVDDFAVVIVISVYVRTTPYRH